MLALHRAHPGRYPFLLESAARGGAHARYDILFAFPGSSLALNGHGLLQGSQARGNDFLASFDAWWREERLPCDEVRESAPPFRGGWFVFFGYELAGQIEPKLRPPAAAGNMPAAFAVRVPAAIIRDHHACRTWLVAEEGGVRMLDAMSEDIAALVTEREEAPRLVSLREDAPDEFLAGVTRIQDYILSGDVFQVNLSRAWRGKLSRAGGHAALYERLRTHNPAPFAGLAVWNGAAIVSSSPERLVRVNGQTIETRPIAGTRPRGAEHGADMAFSHELLRHPKERAEHVMLIDLERNDLGRVCVPGSVRVNELMAIESFAHVHHIVSNVQGRLRDNVTPGEVIRAVFPGGTITGCPKVRCMEIIVELERAPRGAYTGSMGYINRDGSMDINILIRTLLVEGDTVTWRAGAGIVADSVPEAELAETRAKAKGLMLALGAGT